MADYSVRRWKKPSVRAGEYAEEKKLKVHKRGKKNGKELTDFESGLRLGYLQCQSDHAGMYKFKKAMSEGKSIEEARAYSKTKSAKATKGKK